MSEEIVGSELMKSIYRHDIEFTKTILSKAKEMVNFKDEKENNVLHVCLASTIKNYRKNPTSKEYLECVEIAKLILECEKNISQNSKIKKELLKEKNVLGLSPYDIIKDEKKIVSDIGINYKEKSTLSFYSIFNRKSEKSKKGTNDYIKLRSD